MSSDPERPRAAYAASEAAIQPFDGETLARAEAWAGLAPDDLRRRAASAANGKDEAELWALTEAYLFLHGSKGARVSKHTLRTYRRGMADLVAAWGGENLLRPSRDAGVVYMRRLEAGALTERR